MFQLILKFIILTAYLIIIFNKTGFCFSKNKHFYDLNHNIKKEFCFPYVKKQNFNFLSEISYNFFKKNNNLKYEVNVSIPYNLNDKNFLFFENKSYFNNCFFKNVLLFGCGYHIFNGPIYFSQIKFSPSLYYVRNVHNKNYFKKILINNSWTYSHQLINDTYYAQHLTTSGNFEHIVTKLEHALVYSIKKNTIFLKCSYNIILNENKFYGALPNVNKYISMSLICSL